MMNLKDLIEISKKYSNKDIVQRVVEIFQDEDVSIYHVSYNRLGYLFDNKIHNNSLERAQMQKFGFQETLDKLAELVEEKILVYTVKNKHYIVQFIFDSQGRSLISILGFKRREIPPGEKERRLAEANGEYLK